MKILLLPILLLGVSGCAQPKQIVAKAHAFYQLSLPGNIPVDEQGNPEHRTDTVYLLYLEGGKPAPDVAWLALNGKTYRVSVVELPAGPVPVGKRGLTDETIVIKPQAGTLLWKLELTPVNERVNRTGNRIALRTGKNLRVMGLPPLIELQPLPMY